MIERKKFDDLTEEEKGILGESIGLPDYKNDDDLLDSLNTYWDGIGGVEGYIKTVSKLL